MRLFSVWSMVSGATPARAVELLLEDSLGLELCSLDDPRRRSKRSTQHSETTDPTTRTQDARFQERRLSAKMSLHAGPRSVRRGSRTWIDLAGMQRHRDERRAAEHHIDTDQQPDRPGCGAGQACENDSGQDQVDDAAR